MAVEFLITGSAVVASAVLAFGIKSTLKTNMVLRKLATTTKFHHNSLGALMATVEVTQFVHTIQHASVIAIIATILLFGLWRAVKSETGGGDS